MVVTIKLNRGNLQECHKKVLKIFHTPDITFVPKLIGDYHLKKKKFNEISLK